MAEPEKSGAVDQHGSEARDFVGWFVRLEVMHSRTRREDRATEEDAGGLEDLLRLIEADFRQLTVPLLGRSERVLPSRTFFRLRRVLARWRDLLFEKTGDASLFRVCLRLGPNALDPDSSPEGNSGLTDDQLKIRPKIDVQIQNAGGEPVSSRALLGRFHPDHREPNIFDAIEETRRLFEQAQRKENEGGA